MIFAISATSESGDHYLWCEQGTPDGIVEKMQSLTDFPYLHTIEVEPLELGGIAYHYGEELKDKIRAAIDTAMDDL